jgi:hypothetical protein
LDLILLGNRIYEAASHIDAGRKGLSINGKEHEGRVSFEDGITLAMTAFQEASNQGFASSLDPQALLLAEYTFISQEFQLCEKSDKDTINSLTKAIESFDDAFLSLQAVEEPCYKIAEKIFPHKGEYRTSGFPKDAFHIAFASHKTRLQNILRAPGINPIEKALLKQRLDNLSTAQIGYVEKQKKALTNEK